MAFEETQRKIANLPNWAKIGLIGIAAILTYLIIKHRKSSTASTGITDATGAAGGIYNVEIPPSGVLGGTSGGGGGSSDTTTTPPTTTTTPVTVPPATTPIVFGGSPPSVPAPRAPVFPTITPMSNYVTRQPIPVQVQPPEIPNSVFESITHGLSPQPMNQGIQGTNTTPPYQR